MLDVWNPSLYSDGLFKMRVLPKLTIDRILLLSVLLSCVYLVLYGTMPADDRKFASASRRKVRSGQDAPQPSNHGNTAYFGKNSPMNAEIALAENGLDFPVLKRPSLPGIAHQDIIGSPAQSNVATCRNEFRTQYLRTKCETSPARNYDYDQGDRQLLRYAVVDHDRKLFYCLIGKAGSKSWLKYLVDSKSSDKKGHLRHNDFLETVGLEMLRNVPLEKVEKQYKDYFKFLVVRHPLQRAVSAFYETVVLHKKYKNKAGALLNFTEFAQGVTTNLMDENPHWRRYINRCKVCKVDYEYIVKTETMNEDIRDFNKVIGNKGQMVQLTHQNQFIDDQIAEMPTDIHHYKYDKTLYTLQRRHPELMKKFINVYGDDMQLFGYKWDWAKGKSSCAVEHNGEDCC